MKESRLEICSWLDYSIPVIDYKFVSVSCWHSSAVWTISKLNDIIYSHFIELLEFVEIDCALLGLTLSFG